MPTHRAVMKRRFTLIELLVVVAIISVLASMLLPALSQARAQGVRTRCMSNQKQTGVALQVYSIDSEEYPWVLNWDAPLDSQDLPTNRSNSMNDGLTGGVTVQKDQANFGLPAMVLLRKYKYIDSYSVVQCASPVDGAQPYYNRQIKASATANGFFFNYLAPDTSLYRIYENPSGGSLAIRNWGLNPFNLYSDNTKNRSTSKRGYSTHDDRQPDRFSWLICPGRFENQLSSSRPGSTFGGYGYEPHGRRPLSTHDPLFNGVAWADFWDLGGVHYVDRVVTYADGHAVYDHQVTPHRAGCREVLP